MSCVEKVRAALKDITADTTDYDAAELLMALLPEGKRSAEARGIIDNLVAAQKNWLHCTERYQQFTATIEQIEADPEDERGASLSSYETDADDAADGRERATESIKNNLSALARLLGEEPPADKLTPDEVAAHLSLQSPMTDSLLGPRPEGCALPAALLVSLLITTVLLAVLR